MKNKYKQSTISVRAGLCTDNENLSLVPPIHLSTTYRMKGFDSKGNFDYSRTANPTRNLLADSIAKLENGSTGVITSTGMSAILLVCQLLSADDIVIIPHDCYGGSYRLFLNLAKRGAFKLEIINQQNEEELAKALAKKPALIWLETPSNPLMRLVDIQSICKKAKNSNPSALIAVDNTFLSPILQQPLELGADISIHSCTKFINGHSDIVSGAVICKDEKIGEELKWWANCIGITGSAFDSYMVMRGIRTLPMRMHAHEENAKQILTLLENHPSVSQIYYPGQTSHPDYKLACRQQNGFGSMLSFKLKDGKKAVIKFLDKLELFTLAQSLGGVESLINHPSTMTHASMSDEAKQIAGVTDDLLRLSVGIEDINDLLADLKQALDI